MDSELRHVEGTQVMPIFEYVCKQCEHEFEALLYGTEKPECPKCHSKKLTAQLSVFASEGGVVFAFGQSGGWLRHLWRPARARGMLLAGLRLDQLSTCNGMSYGHNFSS